MRERPALGSVLLPALFGLAVVACSGPGEGSGPPHTVFDDPGAFSGLPDEPRSMAGSAFWEHWGDGRAELSAYRLTLRRYGEPRQGELVHVTVTEPHDRRAWIKDDEAPEPHRVNVLKLLSQATFQTGIYPYTVTTVVYAPVDRYGDERFAPVKLVGSADEWCGTWQAVLWPGRERLRVLRLSYFAGEGEVRAERSVPPGTLYEDALPIQLRELDGAFADGGEWEGYLVPALWTSRARHRPVAAVPASISRAAGERDGVPATRFTLRYGERVRTFEVERDPPRRLLGWRTEEAGVEVEEAAILGTDRLAYWDRNRPGDEALRGRLGLPERLPGSPVGPGC